VGQVTDLYISADIESDGPIPGEYSMLSFGLAVAGRFDGDAFHRPSDDAGTFYRELRPIAERFDPEALRVSGLDRDRLLQAGADPNDAMAEAAEWVAKQASGDLPVLVGYPVVFDWMFLHWYFVRFAGRSPFGFSGALDMKTMYHQKARVTLDRAGRNDLPANLTPDMPHTHNALDDAREQAEIFGRIFTWDGRPA
jgi:DNA polymerase III epsilon subunit-like protein